ncbi:hypothetical protein [Sphingomonas sp.]|uniref:hypothetical protein n=1 Tax=Sphingomonas sp. TaxID=28214 RepID=UPI002D19CEA4|nr:hypothetical protein [Sphingomonas sp.]HWK36069.1 hypothetical protein [Sphingomonas sp.]
MNRITRIITGIGLASAVVVPSMASAQAWQNINARQARLEQQINQGVRSGALTRNEASQLRNEFRSISRLEARYRVNGLSLSERRDLDRRFDALSAKIRYEKNDRQGRHGRR